MKFFLLWYSVEISRRPWIFYLKVEINWKGNKSRGKFSLFFFAYSIHNFLRQVVSYVPHIKAGLTPSRIHDCEGRKSLFSVSWLCIALLWLESGSVLSIFVEADFWGKVKCVCGLKKTWEGNTHIYVLLCCTIKPPHTHTSLPTL